MCCTYCLGWNADGLVLYRPGLRTKNLLVVLYVAVQQMDFMPPMFAVTQGGVLARWAFFFLPFPTHACFCPLSPNNLEYLLAVSKNLAHPLHPVYGDGQGGGWKWWE